jgi:hypothetical protein
MLGCAALCFHPSPKRRRPSPQPRRLLPRRLLPRLRKRTLRTVPAMVLVWMQVRVRVRVQAQVRVQVQAQVRVQTEVVLWMQPWSVKLPRLWRHCSQQRARGWAPQARRPRSAQQPLCCLTIRIRPHPLTQQRQRQWRVFVRTPSQGPRRTANACECCNHLAACQQFHGRRRVSQKHTWLKRLDNCGIAKNAK